MCLPRRTESSRCFFTGTRTSRGVGPPFQRLRRYQTFDERSRARSTSCGKPSPRRGYARRSVSRPTNPISRPTAMPPNPDLSRPEASSPRFWCRKRLPGCQTGSLTPCPAVHRFSVRRHRERSRPREPWERALSVPPVRPSQTTKPIRGAHVLSSIGIRPRLVLQ